MAKSNAKKRGNKRGRSRYVPVPAPKSKAPDPAPESAEAIAVDQDATLATVADAKRLRGERVTTRELAAKRRLEAKERRARARDLAAMAWELYANVPAKDVEKLAGRQCKQIREQGERYGLPFWGAGPKGSGCDLRQLFPAIFALLKRISRVYGKTNGSGADDRPEESPALESKRQAEARILWLRYGIMLGEWVPREDIEARFAAIARILRDAGNELQKKHGPEPYEIYIGALDECAEVMKRTYSQVTAADLPVLGPSGNGN